MARCLFIKKDYQLREYLPTYLQAAVHYFLIGSVITSKEYILTHPQEMDRSFLNSKYDLSNEYTPTRYLPPPRKASQLVEVHSLLN